MVRTTKRKSKAPARRRMTTVQRKPTPAVAKKKTVKKKPSPKKSTEATKQLLMYHNPFSTATKQPKIPDGKVGESLGFQTQNVRELVADEGTGIMTILLFPGMSAGAIAINENTAVGTFLSPANQINVMGYTGSNSIDYSAVQGGGAGNVVLNDLYANWRIVSQGLRLSLLNPAETDDGWWEAARLHVGADPADYMCMGKDLVLDNTAGVIIPHLLAQSVASGAVPLVNENSYTTGTLRELKNHLFSLHPIRDDHDFVQPRTTMSLDAADSGAVDPVDQTVRFVSGKDNAQELVDSMIDKSFDMIVIKIHGRTDATNRTRLHANLVSNQEIIFAASEREARFHTATDTAMDMNEHAHGIRQNNESSHVIPGSRR